MKMKTKTDWYDRRAMKQGWKDRSAFKLIEIDEQFHVLNRVTKAVNLCASSESWNQVLSRKLYLREDLSYPPHSVPFRDLKPSRPKDGPNENVKIVAVSLQPMAPLPGVMQLQGEVTDMATAQGVLGRLDGEQADLVLSDRCYDGTGLLRMDQDFQRELLLGALHIAVNVLKNGGTFVSKIFKPKRKYRRNLLCNRLRLLFDYVRIFKPDSCSTATREAFIVCKYYNPPPRFDPKMFTSYLNIFQSGDTSNLTGVNRLLIPYITSRDFSHVNQNVGATFQNNATAFGSSSLSPLQVWSDVKNGRVPRFPETFESNFPQSIDNFGELNNVMAAWEQREKETGYLDVAYLNELIRDFNISKGDAVPTVNDDKMCH